jgi:hypothetical protein
VIGGTIYKSMSYNRRPREIPVFSRVQDRNLVFLNCPGGVVAIRPATILRPSVEAAHAQSRIKISEISVSTEWGRHK